MANKITYKDKEDFVVNPTIPEENKISAADMNEIKLVVNDLAEKDKKVYSVILQGKGEYQDDFFGRFDSFITFWWVTDNELNEPIELIEDMYENSSFVSIPMKGIIMFYENGLIIDVFSINVLKSNGEYNIELVFTAGGEVLTTEITEDEINELTFEKIM